MYTGSKTGSRKNAGLLLNGPVDFVAENMEKAKVFDVSQEL